MLASLVEKSLVRLAIADDGWSRYRMLETVREYAREERAGSGEIDKETQTRFHRSDFWGKILTIQGKACLETKAVSGS